MQQTNSLDVGDQSIEDQIQAKGLNAPRVTLEAIEANIVGTYYFTALDGVVAALPLQDVPNEHAESLGLLTFCVLVLNNGFTVTGKSVCASPENFDAEIGRQIARTNAVNEVWPLMGYTLKTRLSKQAI